jgi:hypothetical protein
MGSHLDIRQYLFYLFIQVTIICEAFFETPYSLPHSLIVCPSISFSRYLHIGNCQ